MDDLEDVDRAYLESLMPDGSVPTALVSVVSWIDEEGKQHWRCHCIADAPVTSTLGLLDLAKMDVLARTDTGLPIRYDEP